MTQALAAVGQARQNQGMSSEWTSALVSIFKELSPRSAKLSEILRRHNWNGSQFTSPPDRDQLYRDLLSQVRVPLVVAIVVIAVVAAIAVAPVIAIVALSL